MLRLHQVKCPISYTEEEFVGQICKILHISRKELLFWQIKKKSIDARKKEIQFIYTIDVKLADEHRIERRLLKERKAGLVVSAEETRYKFPKSGFEKLQHRPVVIGMGPAGLFAGLFLAEHGYRPILVERGKAVNMRKKDVEDFWRNGVLNPQSNVQFGEGGAGTFSDGKLNTLVKDISGRNRKVLEIFIEAGAPEEISYENKPHIGTDRLRDVVKNIRNKILQFGGEVYFETQVTDFKIQEENGIKRLKSLILNDKQELFCDVCVLAIGHSARDTFFTLYEKEVVMQAKAFAVGVRMEHPQKMINLSQYGFENHPHLKAADYKLTKKTPDGRGVYSFCMCPGGYVVNASSEQGFLSVNGMSYQDRAGENANSAIIVTVSPEDFKSDHPLAGIEFQRRLERAAWQEGNGKIPLQLFGDFKRRKKTTKLGTVTPCIKGAYAYADLWKVLPEEIGIALLEGIISFGSKINGFDREDALMEGVESRTSSPVRIERGETFESNIAGLYPCGEGAGYAGGITSAAMDGIKVAEAIAKRYAP